MSTGTWNVFAVLHYLPAAAAVLLAAVALVAAHGRGRWMAAVFVCGALAIVTAEWQARMVATPPAPTAANAAAQKQLAAADARVAALESRLTRMQQGDRVIAGPTATALTDFLRRAGGHPVIVSCPPDDVEAYDYANQLVGVLEDAGWDARGPEATRIFGNQPSPSLDLYVNGAQQPEAARTLADAFHKFDIPYQIKLPPTDTVPPPGGVELFVPSKSAAPEPTSGGSAPPR
jgi:hypothetical protein